MRLSLGIKLGFWLALLGAGSTALTGYYVYDRSRNLLIQSSQEKLLTATQVLAQRFSGSLKNISADVGFIASLPLVQQIAGEPVNSASLRSQEKQLADIFSGLLAARKDYLQIRLIGTANHGRELVRADRLGKDGEKIAVIARGDLQEKAYYPYFFETLHLPAGQFYVSNISLNQEIGAHYAFDKPTIRLAMPIRSQDNVPFGIVVIDVDMQDLFDKLSANLPPALKILLTNHEGDYLINPDPAKTFGFDRGRQFLIQNDLPEIKPLLAGKIKQAMLKQANGKMLGFPSLMAFMRVPFGGINQQRYAILGLYTPLESVLADSKVLGLSVIQLTLLFIALATLIGLALARALAKPLNLMAQTVRQHVLGDPLESLPVERNDEVGDLARSFNAMTGRINEQMSAIQAAETRLQTQIDRMPVGLIVWDQDFRVMTWNPAATTIFGYTEAEALGKHPYEFIVPYEAKAAVDEIWDRLLKGGLTAQSVNENITKDGRTIICDWTNTPLKGPDGITTSVLSMVQDVTERKRTEFSLRLAASVFTHAREGIIITDASGSILDVNDTFTQITGYSREEALGQNLRTLNSGRHGPEFYAAMWRDLTSKGFWDGEIWNQRKNGEEFAEMITLSAVRDADKKTLNYVALFTDITPMKKHQQQLEHIAHYDALTNLPNRVLLADRMQQSMLHSQRSNKSLVVAYLDLDGFKAVNDTRGHNIGDELLITISQRMKAALREGDTLARIGGDEFVAVMVDLEQPQDYEPLLARLLKAASDPAIVGDTVLQVSASIGVTLYPQDGADADLLLRHADQAMYQAKLAGKNCYHLFDVAHDTAVVTQHESFERIRRGLEQREFVLFYQPKVNMRTGAVVGAEALIRWRHPERGLLQPAAFLPIIENHLISVTLGEWVIAEALAQMAEWQEAGLYLPVSVNIDALQLQQENFVERLSALLVAQPDVNPSQFELEILETSALEDMTQVSGVMQACHEIGVRFALDDFGTGYSSLTYLKHLPVKLLKIDKSFVRDMLSDVDDLAIVEGVIGLAAAFHREVIAEGVETTAHGTLLLSLGCELAQGYAIARPMEGADLPGWVANWRPDAAWKTS